MLAGEWRCLFAALDGDDPAARIMNYSGRISSMAQSYNALRLLLGLFETYA